MGTGPTSPPGSEVTYAYGPLAGAWAAIVEVDVAKTDDPWLSEVGMALSKALGTHALSLMVHDDDLLFYNLDYAGKTLDGYNSNPQYFEQERRSEESVMEQRHSPMAFVPLLPPGVSLSSLEAVLNQVWWAAHDAGQLDEDGVPTKDDDLFGFEGDRLQELGNLLRLHGTNSGYPFAGWVDAEPATWGGFTQVSFARVQHVAAADAASRRG